jgi:hypothetical protein
MNGPSTPREHLATLASFAPRAAQAAWAGGIAFALGLAATAVVALSTSRLYRSEAVLIYERGAQSGALGGDDSGARSVAMRLKDMVNSRQRLEGLIKDMKLYHATLEKKGILEATEEMRRRIGVSTRDSYAHRVTYDGDSPDAAKNVLEKLVNGVVDEERQRKTKEAEDTKRFLVVERQHADEDLKNRESTLTAFLTKHPQLAAETGAAAAAGGVIRAADRDRASSSGGEVASLELQKAQLEESLASLGRQPSGVRIDPMLDPQLAAAKARAQTELEVAQRDLAEKQTHLTSEHPDVKLAMRRVAAAEAAARQADRAAAAWHPPASSGGESAAASSGGEDGRAGALRRAIAAIGQQIAAVRGRAAPHAELPKTAGILVSIDTEWTRLNREVSEARERQNQLETKQFQAELAATLAAAGQGGQLVVADPPFRPLRPVTGGRQKIVMMGAVGSLVLGLMALGLFAAFDDRLYAARDVGGMFDDGIVVVIPSVPKRLPAKSDGPAPGARDGAKGEDESSGGRASG